MSIVSFGIRVTVNTNAYTIVLHANIKITMFLKIMDGSKKDDLLARRD